MAVTAGSRLLLLEVQHGMPQLARAAAAVAHDGDGLAGEYLQEVRWRGAGVGATESMGFDGPQKGAGSPERSREPRKEQRPRVHEWRHATIALWERGIWMHCMQTLCPRARLLAGPAPSVPRHTGGPARAAAGRLPTVRRLAQRVLVCVPRSRQRALHQPTGAEAHRPAAAAAPAAAACLSGHACGHADAVTQRRVAEAAGTCGRMGGWVVSAGSYRGWISLSRMP